MQKNIDELIKNINEDIDRASKRDIEKIYKSLKALVKKYDNDTFIEDIIDNVTLIFKVKRNKCKAMLKDIIEELQEDTFSQKEALRKDLLELSNISRTFLENLRAILGVL